MIKGGGGDDKLYGEAGNDTLDGGSGYDTLTGGTGNDTFIIVDRTKVYGNSGGYSYLTDSITEAANSGIDTVLSSVDYTFLSANVENLTLLPSNYVDEYGDGIVGSGNNLNNIIVGNSGDNIKFEPDLGRYVSDALNGGGGNDKIYGMAGNDALNGDAGRDTLIGGTGNDFYFSDGADTIIEKFNQGIDTVYSSVSYTLTDNSNLENLKTGVNGTGNAKDNLINGGYGNNVLDGGKGNDALNGYGGSDIIYGGDGFDYLRGAGTTFYSDQFVGGDQYLDGGAGNDTLNGGYGNDTLIGSSGNDSLFDSGDSGDVLIGGDGNDTLSGAGAFDAGLGYGADDIDTLTGGAGADRFVYTVFSGMPLDTITDFTSLQKDKIEVDGSRIGLGQSECNKFTFDSITGALFVNSQYNGLIQFGSLQPNTDFVARRDIIIT